VSGERSRERDALRARLEGWLATGLAAVHGGRAVGRHLSGPGQPLAIAGRPLPADAGATVLALGKAAAAMAEPVAAWAGARLRAGLLVTREGHGGAVPGFERIEAGHPVPDARSVRAAERALVLAREAAPGDRLVVLLSGGASALTTAPLPGLTLPDLARTTEVLLRSGADIFELNAVRKTLTRLSGGRLAAAARCPIEVLVISDVPGDRLEIVGSGPCVADERGFAEAWHVVADRALAGELPDAVVRHLRDGLGAGARCGPAPGEIGDCRHHVVASGADAAAAIAAAVEASGRARAVVCPGALAGEARDCGRRLVAEAARRARWAAGPIVLVATGETTVTVRGRGRGGRSQELALAAGLALAERPAPVAVLAAGSDGSDGPTDAAGAFADAATVARARAAGVDPEASLAANDAYGLFGVEGGLLRTGPTDTNVMDLALVWADGGSPEAVPPSA